MWTVANERGRWDLATESIVVKIRWFGIVMGCVLVQIRMGLPNPSAVRAFLALGAGYAALDTAFYRFGRLNVVAIHLPPLLDRREDIPELVPVLVARQARRLGKRVDGVDNATMRGLLAAPWKGNVRELDNALERAVILADGPILTPDDFPPA